MQDQILLVGKDEVLLATRAMILRRRWSTSVASPKSAIEKLKAQRPRLLILCHTLSDAETDSLVKVCAAQVPAVRTVELIKRFTPGDHLETDATVEVYKGPALLLETVENLLAEN